MWLSIPALFTFCGSGDDLARATIQDYNNDELSIETSFQVYHESRDSSKLYIKLNTKNLLYTRRNSETFAARVEIRITPYVLGDANIYKLKGKTIRVNDFDDSKTIKDLLATTTIFLPDDKDYSLNIKIIDLNKQREITKTELTEKHYPYSGQYFIATHHDARVPLFSDRIEANETYTLRTNASPSGIIHVKYYNRSFNLPPPPFAYYDHRSFDYTPDSTFSIMLDPWNKVMFSSGDAGFYHFQTDPEAKQGFTLFVSNSDHPEVTEFQQMVDPFRYLLSNKEFANIIKDAEQKKRLESYWIEWCGNKERARSSIKAYYTRVEEANKYFSSHVDGWKSDRGLVYIVYGKPNKVYRSSTVETWIYGEENNPMSITFNFTKVINPFTGNDFRLNREEYYKPTWYRSLEAWRNGRIY